MLHPDSARNRLIGIGLSSLCFLLFTVLDGTAKWLVTVMPVFMVVWLRFVTQAVFGGLLLFPMKGPSLFKTRHLRWHLLRALMFMLMTGMNFWALQYLQITVTASIFFTAPIIIALISARVLDEKLDAGRWIDSSLVNRQKTAEIVSDTDYEPVPGEKEPWIAIKRRLYLAHPPCEAVILIDPYRVDVRLDLRTKDGLTTDGLTSLDERLTIPTCGLQCLVSDVYKGTPLTRRRDRASNGSSG